MGFVPIVNGRGPQWAPKPRVRLYISRTGRQLLFSVTSPVVNQVGWNSGDRILVAFGTGSDLGQLSLSKVKRGGQKLTHYGLHKTGYGVSVTFPREGIDGITRDSLGAVLKTATDCEFEMKAGRLLVTIPLLRAIARKPVLEAVS